MSGIVKSVKKVFKSKIFKVIVIAAAVWFTAGMAAAYFVGPTAGSLGASAAASANSMWTSTTAFFGAEAAGAGAVEAAATSEGMLAVGGATSEAATVGALSGEAATTASVAATPLAAPAAEGVTAATAAGESALMADSLAGTMPAAVDGTITTAGSTVGSGGKGIIGRAMEWVGDNPIPTMILGQAGVGAYEGYLLDKEQEREDEYRRSRGLMGFDYGGNRGLVNSAAQPVQQTTAQAVAEPAATPPTVAPQVVARPVDRKNLPQLKQQGLIASQKV